MSIIEKIRPKDEASRQFLPGIVAFGVGLIGVGLGVVADWMSVRWLGYVAFVLVAGTVFGMFIFIAWSFVKFRANSVAIFSGFASVTRALGSAQIGNRRDAF